MTVLKESMTGTQRSGTLTRRSRESTGYLMSNSMIHAATSNGCLINVERILNAIIMET